MGKFTPKTYSDFVERLTGRLVARTELSDTEIGGIAATIINAVAREFDDLHYQMTNLQLVWDIDTASGEDLDERARDVSPDEVTRLGKTTASGTLSFHRTDTTNQVTIPAGTVAKTSDGVEYATAATTTINAGDTSRMGVTAVAVVGGVEGNITDIGLRKGDPGGPTGVSLLSGAVAGVEEVNNDSPFTGGQDEETDAQLRERIKLYLRSLPRGTPDALRSAVLGASLTGFGRIVTAEVVEEPEPKLGHVTVYVDDGAGTIEHSATVVDEQLIGSATGGEKRFKVANWPIVADSDVQVVKLPAGGGSPVGLTEGADFTMHRPTGQLTLTTALATGDSLRMRDQLAANPSQPGYQHYTGLIQKAQQIIEGSGKANDPGYRAAGVSVTVLSPTVFFQTVNATVVVETGFDLITVTTGVKSAIQTYINSLPINGDVIATELIYAAQTVGGVVDITFQDSSGLTIPLTNTIIGEGEIARALSSSISVTGA